MLMARRNANTLPCSSGATLACQMAWLQALVIGPQNMAPNPHTASNGIDTRRHTAARNSPSSMKAPSMVKILCLLPPQALITSVPASMPTPINVLRKPRVLASQLSRISGTSSGPTTPERKLKIM